MDGYRDEDLDQPAGRAAVFCLFFAGPDGTISVAAVDARSEGLTRVPLARRAVRLDMGRTAPQRSAGLHADDIIGQPGTGMRLLREHFADTGP